MFALPNLLPRPSVTIFAPLSTGSNMLSQSVDSQLVYEDEVAQDDEYHPICLSKYLPHTHCRALFVWVNQTSWLTLITMEDGSGHCYPVVGWGPEAGYVDVKKLTKAFL